MYVDHAYSFSLSEGALVESGLASGQVLSVDDIDAYKRLSSQDKAYNGALRYAAMRRRSIWEMEQYLRRKEVSVEQATSILGRLRELRFLDDLAFARAWVENRHLLKPTSRRKLQLELRAKRVSAEIIDQVLRDDEVSDSHELRMLIDRKRKQSKYQDDQKLMQYLARQGFGYQDIKAALEQPD